MMPDFAYVSVDSLKDAIKQLSSPGAKIHAGGTDLLSCLRDDIFPVEKIVSLSRLDGLRGIKEAPDGGIRIGALTTITEVASHPLVRDRYPAVAQAASAVGSPQLRNQGTIGGNLCQKPRSLVLPWRVPLPAQRGRPMFCNERPEPVSRHNGVR